MHSLDGTWDWYKKDSGIRMLVELISLTLVILLVGIKTKQQNLKYQNQMYRQHLVYHKGMQDLKVGDIKQVKQL